MEHCAAAATAPTREEFSSWCALQSLRSALAESVPEDVTAEAARLLTAEIEPRLRQVKDDLDAIRQGLQRLREPPPAEPPAPIGARTRRRPSPRRGADG